MSTHNIYFCGEIKKIKKNINNFKLKKYVICCYDIVRSQIVQIFRVNSFSQVISSSITVSGAIQEHKH